ncbi:hypothetical protein FWF64_02740 [Candidatus Saccharibacteria bacterium]|nr:hypothetical protein [Candidatus Saccharibacteria bacterium]
MLNQSDGGTDGDDIMISLLSQEEQSHVLKYSKDMIREYLAQDSNESDADWKKRFSQFLTDDSPIINRPAMVSNISANTPTAIVKMTVEISGDISWSDVTESQVTVYASTNITHTDNYDNSFTDSSNWFIIFKKSGNTWKIYDIEQWWYPAD